MAVSPKTKRLYAALKTLIAQKYSIKPTLVGTGSNAYMSGYLDTCTVTTQTLTDMDAFAFIQFDEDGNIVNTYGIRTKDLMALLDEWSKENKLVCDFYGKINSAPEGVLVRIPFAVLSGYEISVD